MGSVWPPEVTPPINDERAQQFAREINPDALLTDVKRAGRPRPLGNCYWNVARVVEESGGETIPGWAIMWWPDLYFVAMHHAIWKMRDGRLLDVTKTQPADQRSEHTLFLPDDRLQVSLDRVPCIDNLFFTLERNPLVLGHQEEYRRVQEARRQLCQIDFDTGYRCEALFAMAARKEPPPPKQIDADPFTADRYKALISEHARASSALGQAIERLIDRANAK